MRAFKYLSPETLDEAVSMMASDQGRARYIAGGTDVMVKIREKKIAPDVLISLKKIPGMDHCELNAATGEFHIGALVTHGTLERSAVIRRDYTILNDAVANIGSIQVRNVATIGGNLVNAVPSADGAIPLIALDARVKYYGPTGENCVDLIKFFLGPGQNCLEPPEILTEIIVPKPLPVTGGAYIKFGRRAAMELPLLGVGVLLSMDETRKKCCKARICLGVAAPTPIRALAAETYLEGRPIDDAALEKAGIIAGEESRVRDSIRGVAWYRRAMVNVQVKRMGLKCMERIAAAA